MKKLLTTLFLLFTLITTLYSQQQDSSLKQIKDKSLSFDILFGISTYSATMDYLRFDAGIIFSGILNWESALAGIIPLI
jgi:hypothetical protein